MFRELTQESRNVILNAGEVKFRPAVKWKGVNASTSYARYEMFFCHVNGGEDKLGTFYLTLRDGYCYEMAALDLTAQMGKGLQLFTLELILKAAIKEAAENDVGEIIVECNHSLMPDAFLNCGFEIERLAEVNPKRPMWSGRKTIDSTKVHPLVSMAKGMGTL